AELLYDAGSAEPASPEHAAASAARSTLRKELLAFLADAPMDQRDRLKLVDDFVTKLSGRQVNQAYQEFFTTLATVHSNAMGELAATLDESPWLRLNRVVEDVLREFATAVSLTDMQAHSFTGATPMPVARAAVAPYTRYAAPAATEMVTGAIETGSWDLFRLQTIFKYNAYREATSYTAEEQAAAIAALVERFTAKNDGLVRSGDKALFESTIIQKRSQDWLWELARESKADLGASTVEEALVLIATAHVPDVDVRASSLRSS